MSTLICHTDECPNQDQSIELDLVTVDAWTGAEYQGGGWITAPAPLDTIPVFLRAGGRLQPFGPVASLGPAENSGE